MLRGPRVLASWIALTALPLAGCYVRARAIPPPPPGEVVVEYDPPPPPPAEVEVVPVTPGPEFIWIGGYHRWNGRHYVWIPGHYDRRPHEGARWEHGHWEGRGRGHVWVEGRWR
jgi:hypothetical protein